MSNNGGVNPAPLMLRGPRATSFSIGPKGGALRSNCSCNRASTSSLRSDRASGRPCVVNWV